MSIFLPFQVLFSRMPPIRRSKRVATPTGPQNSVQGQPVVARPALRSRTARGMSRSTISRGADSLPSTSPEATTIASPAPIVSQPSLSAVLVSTLVSSVTTAVTQQLSALLPTTETTPIFPHEEGASFSSHAENLVNDAITSTHSNLSGQRLPFTIPNSTELFSQQPFHSTSLPLDARVPEKTKVKNLE